MLQRIIVPLSYISYIPATNQEGERTNYGGKYEGSAYVNLLVTINSGIPQGHTGNQEKNTLIRLVQRCETTKRL